MRRLLTIAHSYVLQVNRRLAHEMQIAGGGQWEVTAIAPARFVGAGDIRAHYFEPQSNEPVSLRVLPARWTSNVHLFHYGREINEIARHGFDLVHAWEEPYIAAGWQIARAVPARTPLVFRTAQSLPKRYPFPFNQIERYSVKRMAGWICSGALVQANLKGREGYAERPSRLIPLGVDLNAFERDEHRAAAALLKLRWSSGPPIVGYLGRFVPEKGLRILMEALDRVQTPWRAVFVGGGPMEAELRNWAAGHADQVRVCTDVQHLEVPTFLNAMEILVAPSLTTPKWREQFGRMLIEAFACGVPVIGSDSGEIPYVMGDAGVVVLEGDVAAWADAIGDLIDSPIRRRELAGRGLMRAQERFAWPIIARQYLQFFEEILEERGPA